MKVFIGSDHGGFELKQELFAHLTNRGIDVEDVGAKTYDATDDYPQFAFAAATKVIGSEDEDPRAILICRGGQGMAIAANKVPRIRAVVVWNSDEARKTREHNNANVLSLPAHILDKDRMVAIVDAWLSEPFSKEERHERRLNEIDHVYG